MSSRELSLAFQEKANSFLWINLYRHLKGQVQVLLSGTKSAQVLTHVEQELSSLVFKNGQNKLCIFYSNYICSGDYNKIREPGGLLTTNSWRPWCWPIRVWQGLFLNSYLFSVLSPKVRGQGALRALFENKGTNNIHLAEAPPPNATTFGRQDFNTWIWGDTNIQTAARVRVFLWKQEVRWCLPAPLRAEKTKLSSLHSVVWGSPKPLRRVSGAFVPMATTLPSPPFTSHPLSHLGCLLFDTHTHTMYFVGLVDLTEIWGSHGWSSQARTLFLLTLH